MMRSLIILTILSIGFSADVIIVGGGVSGVTAGNLLKNKGFNVTLLEARDRRGGRLWSDNTKFGYFIDFGGAWIHGKAKNAVYDLAASQNTNLFKFDFDDTKYLSKTISNLSNADDNYYDIGKSFKKYINEVRAKYQPNEDHPLSDIYASYLNSRIISNDQKCYLDNYVYVELEDDYGTSIEDLSAVYFDATREKDKENFLMPNGYWNIFDKLINFDYLNNVKVVSIDQSNAGKVNVYDDKGKTYSADYVLVTVPLGVLKNNIISFKPALSQDKQNAIKGLAMGSLEKIIVEFSKVFWDSKSILKLIESPIEVLGYVANLNKVVGEKTLIFLVAGDGKYYDLYNSSEEELRIKVIKALLKYYPNEDIQITKIAWTKWKMDPFSYGSYSHYPVNSTTDMVKEFSSKEGNLYFAGEHTNKEYIQTVQGAYESGKRAANQIINASSTSSSSQIFNQKKLNLKANEKKALIRINN